MGKGCFLCKVFRRKKKTPPYKYWGRLELHQQLIVQVKRFDISEQFKHHWIRLINDMFALQSWDPVNDFNGCSIVQDHLHPDPACFVHDGMMITGHGGVVCDRIFYHAMMGEGMSRAKSWRRWFGVRIGWLFYLKWRYIKQRRIEPITETMVEFDQFLKDEFGK